MITALKNGLIFTGSQFVHGKALLLGANKITALLNEKDIPPGAEVIDCQNGYVSPGLIDLQIYGGGGVLFSDAPSPEYLHKMAEALLRTGTTSFLITLATNSLDVFKKAIEVVKANPHPAVLGLHFEGPYLMLLKAGRILSSL